MMWRWRGSRWQGIAIGVLIATAPLVALALFVNFSLRGDLETIALERRKISVAAAAHVLQVRLEGDIAYGVAFAGRPLLQKAVEAGNAAEMTRHLQNLVGSSGSMERALICSQAGTRLANYPPDPRVIGLSVVDRDWYKGVVQTRKPYVSEFYQRDAKPRRYLFSVAVPIISPRGKMLGILHMSPKETYLEEALRGLSSHGSGLVYVVDRHGHLIYHPEYAVEGLVDFSSSPAVAKVTRGLDGADKHRDPKTGEMMVAAYHPLTAWGWGVVTELPLKQALAPVTRVVNGFYLFLGAMFIIGGHLAYRRAEHLNRSQSLARQLTERTAELEEANTHLNRQAAELAAQREFLEVKVAERTAVLSREIDARKRAEEALKAASAYNRSLIEASIDPLVTIGPGGEITDVNTATEKVTGRGRVELIGTDFSDYFTEPERARAGYEEAFRKGVVRDYPLEIRHRDGQVTPVIYNAAVYRGEKGEVGVLAAARDISERRDLEKQLRHVQKMEAIGTLAGGIAHDFNNILTAIIGFGGLLEMQMAEDDPMRASVTQILAAGDRAVNLTRSLLAFSRKEALETKPVDVNGIVTGMEKMLHRLIREDFELHINPAPRELTVMADVGQIEQVLLNLATNARDAMPSGGTITIAIAPFTLDEEFSKNFGFGEPGDYAELVFADDGAGMDEETRQRIFEPFFTTKEVGKGTGLGLSICYGIVKQHRGYINCYSEPGNGTTFRVYLPLIHAAAQHEAKVSAAPRRGKGETILVAEDDPGVRKLTTSLLEEFGYTVIQARDGDEAVVRFRERPGEIHLCLFDVVMPKKKGREAFEEIRAVEPNARVLFMSGYQPDQSLQSGLTAEGVDFVNKPIAPADLLEKVREVLDR